MSIPPTTSSVAIPVPLTGWPRIRTAVTRWVRGHAAMVALLAVLLVLVIVTASQSDVFLTVGNLRNILLQISVLAIVASGMTMLMISGGIDLSVGSLMSLAAVTIALLGAAGVPLPLAILAGFGIGVAVGAGNGLLAAWGKAHPFIVTLGVSILLQGVALSVSGGVPISTIDPALISFGASNVLGIPGPVLVAAAVLLLTGLVLRYTVFGRTLYALGGSEPATRLAGIPVRRMKVLLYAINGVVVTIAAIVLMSRIASAQPLMGTGYELQAIAAVAVGGTPLAGGRGSIVGTLLGVVLLGVISNSLNLLGVSGSFQYVLQGAVIVVAVMSQRRL